MASIDAACEWMRKACEDWSVGYDQSNRWDFRDGGEMDCSSGVISALKMAGFDVGGATYTGNMSDELTARGWRRIPFTSVSQVRKGDILLNDTYHTCMVISGSGATAKIAQASIDENGRASGGRAGDQTGYETNIKTVYVYSRGWDCILRYEGGDDGATSPVALDVDGYCGPMTIARWQEALGLTPDGVVSGQSWECSEYFPRLVSVTYEADGSLLMRRVQEIVGVPNPTGIIGPGSICYIQGWLWMQGYEVTDAAGVWGRSTAKGIQQSLNDGRWSM